MAILKYEEVKFFFEKFKGGDANDITYRMALIDTFINKIYVFDGEDSRLEIYCNAIKQKIICSLGKLTRSPKEQLAHQFEPNTNVTVMANGFVIIIPIKCE